MSIPYDPRFGAVLPSAAWPLPSRRLSIGKPPAWWDAFLVFAEEYVQRSEKDLIYIPKKFQCLRGPLKSFFLRELHAEIITGLSSYARWVSIPADEDIPSHFPKGVQVLVEHARRNVIHAIELARTRDLHRLVVEAYVDAYDRCRSLCDARRRGHLAERGASLSFSCADVKRTMTDAQGWVGLVDYGHVRKILLAEASIADASD